jgi:hypothetical protein
MSDVLKDHADQIRLAEASLEEYDADHNDFCIADLAAEVRSLRDSLRALVEDRWSGCFDYDGVRMYCTYCTGEMKDDPWRVEHGPDCLIRKARVLLGIPAEGVVIEHA